MQISVKNGHESIFAQISRDLFKALLKATLERRRKR
jgi:hypothetical protein